MANSGQLDDALMTSGPDDDDVLPLADVSMFDADNPEPEPAAIETDDGVTLVYNRELLADPSH